MRNVDIKSKYNVPVLVSLKLYKAPEKKGLVLCLWWMHVLCDSQIDWRFLTTPVILLVHLHSLLHIFCASVHSWFQ